MSARIVLAFGLILGVLFSAFGAAMPAAAEVSVSVFPALMDLSAPAGAMGEQTITFANDGDEELDATVAATAVAGIDPARSAVPWLTLSTDQVHLAPGEKVDVIASIAVPDGTATGGYYAQVTLTTGAPDAGGNSASISGQISNGIMITVQGDGDLVRKLDVDQIAPVIEADGRIGFRASLTNGGNVHLLEPAGLVQVLNADGSALGSLEISPTTPLLPGATRLFATQGSLPLTPGATYKANVSLTYLNESKPVTAEFEFTVAANLEVANVSICENLDRGPSIALSLNNGGSVALQPQIGLSVSSQGGSVLGNVSPEGASLIWPGQSVDLAADYPQRLESGAYSLSININADPAGQPIMQEIPFQIGGLDGTPIPLCTS